jgi:hypothetical protein
MIFFFLFYGVTFYLPVFMFGCLFVNFLGCLNVYTSFVICPFLLLVYVSFMSDKKTSFFILFFTKRGHQAATAKPQF